MACLRLAAALLALAALACGPAGAPAGGAPARSAPRPPPPRAIVADDGPVEPIVRSATNSAAAEGAQLVVYVGAAWCEPCVAFHDALARGDLAGRLDGAVFLEFDLDRDQSRLAAAGYTSRLVPLFALPDAAGRASGAQIEGGVKGAGAVENLVGRLGPLLADSAPR